jgi:hypothetical protein
MLKKSLVALKDIERRHVERHSTTGFRYAFSDSISFVNQDHWDLVAQGKSIFLGRGYLAAIERFAPLNITCRYAMIYRNDHPIAILACQIADLAGDQMARTEAKKKNTSRVLAAVRQRMLVCGNLISCGLHGVAFVEDVDVELGWRAVAEALYRMRRSEKLNGNINLVLIKDLKGEQRGLSNVLRRYSYRSIKTDPDMLLSFAEGCRSYEDYLGMLTSKYRGRIKKIRQSLLDAHFTAERLSVADIIAQDAVLHALYLQVEKRAAIRPATIAPGYFAAMAQALGDHLRCAVLKHAGVIVGFIVTLKDGCLGISYYVGIDYHHNTEHSLYFGLLQLSVEDALAMECRCVSLGRTALEPKANLGAKPVETHVWLRHRIPLVNFTLRPFLSQIPCDEAPIRGVLKADA